MCAILLSSCSPTTAKKRYVIISCFSYYPSLKLTNYHDHHMVLHSQGQWAHFHSILICVWMYYFFLFQNSNTCMCIKWNLPALSCFSFLLTTWSQLGQVSLKLNVFSILSMTLSSRPCTGKQRNSHFIFRLLSCSRWIIGLFISFVLHPFYSWH